MTGQWVWMIYRVVFSGFVDLFVSRGLKGRDLRFPAAIRPDGGQIDADARLCSAHCCDQRADAHDLHDPFEIVGQHMRGHFGAEPFFCVFIWKWV